MIPSRPALALLAAWTALGLAASIWPPLRGAWWTAGGALGLLGLLDALLALRLAPPAAHRTVSATLPSGAWSEVGLRLENPSALDLRLQVFDHGPAAMDLAGLPRELQLPGRGWALLTYRVRPRQRGAHAFGRCQLRFRSPLGLWWRNVAAGAESPVRVFPNFAAVRKYALLATRNRLSQLGIHKRRRRGEGMEFHQLREYRQGDAMRQIDWKATARQRKLISREYTEERDQQVLFLLDCGRRLRAQDGPLAHFDHVLNAVLLLSYVALRQGDAVGLQTFGGRDLWLSPRKSPAALDGMMESLYDLEPTRAATDYVAGARDLMLRAKKRSLLVLVTNLRDEEDESLGQALQLLRQRHLVLLANLRERVLEDVLQAPVRDFDDALLHGATHQYLAQRRAAFERLHARGVVSLDVRPEELPVALVNQYLELKRGGRI